MLHGMIYARHAKKLNVDPQHDFKSEVRTFFGSGTQMQEMYITPKLLTRGQLGRARRVRPLVARKCRHAGGHALGRRRSDQAEGLWLGGLVAAKGDFDAPQSRRTSRRRSPSTPPRHSSCPTASRGGIR